MPKVTTKPSAWLTDEQVEDAKQNANVSGSFFNLSKMEPKTPYRIRFVGEGTTGWVGWTEDKKPHRLKLKPSESDYHPKIKRDEGEPYRYFIAGVAYVEKEDTFKVVEITQKTLIKALTKFIQMEDYGDPTGYTLELEKEGSGKESKYTLVALPPKAMSKALAARAEEVIASMDMSELFRDGDPLNPKAGESTADAEEEEEEEEEEGEEEEEDE